MGASHSTNSKGGIPLRECEQDLHWVLNENAQWAERNGQARRLLDSSHSQVGGWEHAYNQTLRTIDDLLSAHGTTLKKSAGTPRGSHSSTHGHHERYTVGAGSDSDIFDMEHAVELPRSHPAHELQATHFFSLAATAEMMLLAKLNPQRAQDQQANQRNLQQVTDMARNSMAQAHRSDTTRNLHALAPTQRRDSIDSSEFDNNSRRNSLDLQPATSTTTVHLAQPHQLTHENVVPHEQHRLESEQSLASGPAASGAHVELATKYLFIHALLERMISSSQASYQTCLQMETLRKKLKPKRVKGLNQTAIQEMQDQQILQQSALTQSRELFLRSKLTLAWFRNDFDLSLAEQLLIELDSTIRAHRPSTAVLATDTGSAHRQHDNLTDEQKALSTRREQVLLRKLANERYALSIAHYYLRRHSPGYGMRSTDAPELDPALFAALDPTGQHIVTRGQMQTALVRMSEQLDNGTVDNTTPRHHSSTTAPAMDLTTTRRTLRTVYALFLHTFVRNAFVGLELEESLGADGVPQLKSKSERLDAAYLNKDLQNIEMAAPTKAALLNPLDASTPTHLALSHGVRPKPLDATQHQQLLAVAGAPTATTPASNAAPISALLQGAEQKAMLATGIMAAPAAFGSAGSVPQASPAAHSSLLAKTARPLPPSPMNAATGQPLQPVVRQGAAAALFDSGAPSTSTLAVGHVGTRDAPNNSTLATAVHPEDVQAQHDHLRHVEAVPSMFGGQHDPNAQVMSEDVKGMDKRDRQSRSAQDQIMRIAEGLRQPDQIDPQEHSFLNDQLKSQGLVPAHTHLITTGAAVAGAMVVAAAVAPTTTYERPAANAALATAITPNQLASGVSELSHVDSAGLQGGLVEGSYHPAGALVSSTPSTDQLQRQAMHLAHPNDTIQGPHGSVHSKTALLATTPTAAELRAQANKLHDVPASDLKEGKIAGSIHPTDAIVSSPHDPSVPLPESLIAHKAELHHVSYAKAQVTSTGGIHTLTKANLRTIPDQTLLNEDTPANIALARVVHASALRAQAKELDNVPSDVVVDSHGSRHTKDAIAASGIVHADQLQDQAHHLNHVHLPAKTTPSGGVHLVAQPDTKLLPHDVLSSEQDAGSSAALAGVVQASALKHTHLKHVPLETQRQTMSGGVHMADTSATLHPTLMDRFKNVLGMEAKSMDTTPKELGHVVASPSKRAAGSPKHVLQSIAQSAREQPVLSGSSLAASAVPRSASLHSAQTPAVASGAQGVHSTTVLAQNALLAEQIHTADLSGAHAKLTALPAMHGVADVITPAQLTREHAALQPPTASMSKVGHLVTAEELQKEHAALQPAVATMSQVGHLVTANELQKEHAALQPAVAAMSQVGHLVTAEELKKEHDALVPAVAANKALSEVVGNSDLIMARRDMHHVDVDSVERRREVMLDVGHVTTRRPSTDASAQEPQQRTTLVSIEPSVTRSNTVEVVPSPRMPTVQGRRASADATAMSAFAFNKIEAPLPGAIAATLPNKLAVEGTHLENTRTAVAETRFEQQTAIPAPQQQLQ